MAIQKNDEIQLHIETLTAEGSGIGHFDGMAVFVAGGVPGDTLLFKVDLLAPIRHGISSMKGYVFVGDHVVSEATFTAQIVKNK